MNLILTNNILHTQQFDTAGVLNIKAAMVNLPSAVTVTFGGESLCTAVAHCPEILALKARVHELQGKNGGHGSKPQNGDEDEQKEKENQGEQKQKKENENQGEQKQEEQNGSEEKTSPQSGQTQSEDDDDDDFFVEVSSKISAVDLLREMQQMKQEIRELKAQVSHLQARN